MAQLTDHVIEPGTRLPPITWPLLDAAGAALDLTGMTVVLVWRRLDQTTADGTETACTHNNAGGVVTIPSTPTMTATSGVYVGVVWFGDAGTLRDHPERIYWAVATAVAPAPTV